MGPLLTRITTSPSICPSAAGAASNSQSSAGLQPGSAQHAGEPFASQPDDQISNYMVSCHPPLSAPPDLFTRTLAYSRLRLIRGHSVLGFCVLFVCLFVFGYNRNLASNEALIFPLLLRKFVVIWQSSMPHDCTRAFKYHLHIFVTE